MAGNRLVETVTVGGALVTTPYSYNAANQLVSDGSHTLTYDNNGNLTNDGVNTYTWDRANRLRSMGGLSYGYDGLGNRVWQSNGLDVTQYLLDVPPGLAVVLSATTSTDTTRYVHGPRGLHAQQDNTGAWNWTMQDGLGSVRGVADDTLTLLESRQYAPYGEPYSVVGVPQTVYGFTGELRDSNGLQFHRARYLNPALGVFVSPDLVEGMVGWPNSLDGYSWVKGNTSNSAVGEFLSLINGYNYAGGHSVNRVDRSGMYWVNPNTSPGQQAQCYDAWLAYTNTVTIAYTQDWPRDVRILVTQEARYWDNLSYSEFVSQWNSSNPSASTDPGGEVLQSSLPVLGGISFAHPAPGSEDLVAMDGLCIVAIWAIAANAGAISLPLRQTYYFSDNTERPNEVEIPWPIPPTRDGAKVSGCT